MRISDITFFNEKRTVPSVNVSIHVSGEFCVVCVDGTIKMFFKDRVDMINFKNQFVSVIDEAINDSIGG